MWPASTLQHVLVPITGAAALGCGIMAGLLFAFSAFVMRALERIPVPEGIRAMQAINVTIVTPLFLTVFLGTALASILLAVVAWAPAVAPAARYLLLSASLLYLVGVIGVTAVFNVPLNDALAGKNPDSAEAARFWLGYVATWTAWNHVRTAAALGSTGAFMFALRALAL